MDNMNVVNKMLLNSRVYDLSNIDIKPTLFNITL